MATRRGKPKREGSPVPGALDAPTSNSIGKAGEKRTQRVLGAVLTSGSGSGATKGDLMHGRTRTGRVTPRGYRRMIEKKTTGAMSMKLDSKWLDKLVEQAFDMGKEPVLVIEMADGKPWAMVPIEKMKEYWELEDERNGSDQAEGS